LHTGEVEMMDDDIGGIAVHIASRIGSMAETARVFTSGTVKDLVAGSGISFEDRGTHALKGVPDDWRVFAVTG
jgi:class 3 adenylate cyclase